jgi:membrane associated rhomboid family serine protease
MGIYDRDYIDPRFSQPKKKTFLGIRTSSSLMNLVFINITVFIILYFLYVIYLLTNSNEQHFRQQALGLFVLPAQFSDFILQPWSIITFMFTHFELGNIFSNMLWLWAFGSILDDLTGDGKTIPAYIYGSLAGGIVFIFVNSVFHPLVFGTQLNEYYGASAGVMAIAIAATSLEPDYRLFPNIGRGLPLWIFTLLYVTLSLASAYLFFFVLLSGGLTGFLLIYFLKKGRDWSRPLEKFFNWSTNLFTPAKQRRPLRKKFELHYQSKGSPYKKTPNVNQQKVDEILDKISKEGGTHNLSKEEKDILRRAGEEL